MGGAGYSGSKCEKHAETGSEKMLWNHLKSNFRPQLVGVKSSSSSSVLSKDIISIFQNFATGLNCAFIHAKKPKEFLLDGAICDTAINPKGAFPFPTESYWGIEWEWDPSPPKWQEFIVHDFIKLFHFSSDRKVAIYLRDKNFNPNARSEVESSMKSYYPNKSIQINIDIIEIERIGSGNSYTLDMHLLRLTQNRINQIDTIRIFP